MSAHGGQCLSMKVQKIATKYPGGVVEMSWTTKTRRNSRKKEVGEG